MPPESPPADDLTTISVKRSTFDLVEEYRHKKESKDAAVRRAIETARKCERLYGDDLGGAKAGA